MGRFVGDLVLDPLPSNPRGPIRVVRKEFGYVDDISVKWTVPRGLKTDGASVPLIFQPIIGGAFRPEFLPASVIHDHYCTVRTRPWGRTQRVFYEILRFSGVPLIKANAMYYAVLVGSRKWGALGNERALPPSMKRMRGPSGAELLFQPERLNDPALEAEVRAVQVELETVRSNASAEEVEHMAFERHPDDPFLAAATFYPVEGFPEMVDGAVVAFNQDASRLMAVRDDMEDTEPGDFSRSEIAELFDTDQTVVTRSLKRRFVFPDDMEKGREYGIDVSHHQGDVAWSSVGQFGPKFAYIKCSEGATFTDPRFTSNVRGARSGNLRVGSYHFMSANVAPVTQAERYLSASAGVRSAADLAPCLDLEWDVSRRTRKDRWIGHSAEDIVAKALAWLQHVEEELGITPIIYTNKSWWDDRIGSKGEHLARHSIWMSRYGGFSNDVPPTMTGFTSTLWQFTDSAKLPGVSGPVDANIVIGEFDTSPKPDEDNVDPVDVPAAPNAQEALSEAELVALFQTLRSIFGRLSQAQVNFLNVLVNTSSPTQLRHIINGRMARSLSEAELAKFFDIARTTVGGGRLEQNQVDILNILLRTSDHDAVRDHIFNQ